MNDIADCVSSSLRLFADDCLLNRTEENAIWLHNDLDQLYLLGRQSGNWALM